MAKPLNVTGRPVPSATYVAGMANHVWCAPVATCDVLWAPLSTRAHTHAGRHGASQHQDACRYRGTGRGERFLTRVFGVNPWNCCYPTQRQVEQEHVVEAHS